MTQPRTAGRPGTGAPPSRGAGRARVLRARLLLAFWMLVSAGAVAVLPSAAASAASRQAPATPRIVMILLDSNSGSLGRLPAARAAALAYASGLPPDVRAGLVTFAAGWHLALRPTTDRSRLQSDVKAVQPAGGNFYTSRGLYGALSGVVRAVPGLRRAGSRLVVISDAENLPTTALTAQVPTDVIVQHMDSDDDVAKLRALAASSGGRMVGPSGAAGLAAAEFPTPAGTHPPVVKTHQPQPARVVLPSLPWPLIGGVAALFVSLFTLTLAVAGAAVRRSRSRDLAGRIQQYGPKHTPTPAADDGPRTTNRVGRAAQQAAQRLMTSKTQKRLAERLDLAGMTRKPAEWALMGVTLGIALAAVFSLVTSFVLAGVLVGALVGWLTMRLMLSLRIARRRVAFADQLPDILQLLASALRAGFSLQQALDAVVREDAQPAAGEFARALAGVRLGGDIDDGLEAVADRMESDDLRWTIMAMRIQQSVGGNLAEVLLTIAGTMRERASLRRHVRALSAEGRLSGYILVALPFLIGAWLFVSSPQYMRPLYTTRVGELILFGACVLLVMGALWMRRMIRVDI